MMFTAILLGEDVLLGREAWNRAWYYDYEPAPNHKDKICIFSQKGLFS